MPGEFRVQKNNLLTTLCCIGKQYFISLEFLFEEFIHKWSNVIQLTTGLEHDRGSRLPIICTMGNKLKELWLCSDVNGDWCSWTKVGSLTPHTWNKVEVEQVYRDSKVKFTSIQDIIANNLFRVFSTFTE